MAAIRWNHHQLPPPPCHQQRLTSFGCRLDATTTSQEDEERMEKSWQQPTAATVAAAAAPVVAAATDRKQFSQHSIPFGGSKQQQQRRSFAQAIYQPSQSLLQQKQRQAPLLIESDNDNGKAVDMRMRTSDISPSCRSDSKKIVDGGTVVARGGDSALGVAYTTSIKTAGRVGTKRFVDPCKVYIGNLPYNTTEGALVNWICTNMGLPKAVLLHHVRLIENWKTKQFKGMAFVSMTEAIFATVCIDKCHGQMWQGRRITVQPVHSKQSKMQNLLFLQNSSTDDDVGDNDDDSEAAVIRRALKVASGEDPTTIPRAKIKKNTQQQLPKRLQPMPMDPEMTALLRRLDPDLLDTDDDDSGSFRKDGTIPTKTRKSSKDHFLECDDEDVDDTYLDHDDNYDDEDAHEVTKTDDTVQVASSTANRQQRRDSDRKTKRIKRPHTGFGV